MTTKTSKRSSTNEASGFPEEETEELHNLDARLRRAEQAYERILQTFNLETPALSPKKTRGNIRNSERESSSNGIHPRVLKLNSYENGEFVQHGTTEGDPAKQVARAKALVPPLRFPGVPGEDDERLQVIEESSRSERELHVSALRSALRPVRLERPPWVQAPAASEGGDSQRTNDDTSHPSFPSSRRISDTETPPSPPRTNPRELAKDIFAGYSLEYPRGKAATPKWQKRPETLPEPPQTLPVVPLPVAPKLTGAWNGSLDSPSSSGSGANRSGASRDRVTSLREPGSGSWGSRGSSRSNGDRSREDRPRPSSARVEKVEKSEKKAEIQQPRPSEPDDDTASQATYITRSKSIHNLPTISKPSRSRLISAPPPRIPQQPFYRRFRGKSLERYMAEREQREVSDMEALKQKFKANPLPAWIHEKRMQEMTQEEARRKEKVRVRAQEMLEQVKPFAFRVARERQRVVGAERGRSVSERGERRAMEGGEKRKTVSERGKRPVEVFRATLPRAPCHKHLPPAPTFQPAINHSVPDFARLHAQLEKQQEERQEKNFTTVPRPFSLNRQPKRDNNKTSSSAPSVFKATAPDYDNFSVPFEEMVRPTRAFKLMTAFSRQKMDEERRNAAVVDEDPLLVERVRGSLLARDEEMGRMLEASKMHHKNRVSEVQESEHGHEYLEMLSDMRQRLSERPFIWERSQMEERKKRIEAKFQQILQNDAVDSIFQRAIDGASTPN